MLLAQVPPLLKISLLQAEKTSWDTERQEEMKNGGGINMSIHADEQWLTE